jgi:hypothetical protein
MNTVSVHDVLSTFEVLADWLHDSKKTLYCSAGNHDLSKTSNVLSSFQFLGRLLTRQFPKQYVHIEVPTMTPYGYVIPHLKNQTDFDAALTAVPQCENLFLHCNYDNNFAAQSDQSLNLSAEQAEESLAKRIVLGHEHHSRRLGKVQIPGNQVASSVADWQGKGDKFYWEDGAFCLCSARADEYAEVDWRELGAEVDHNFIKVVGNADADELSLALTALNKFRAQSSAFVVTNAISVGVDEGPAIDMESVKGFSVLAALRGYLNENEMEVVESLC